jgi:hypothetical protein
MGNHKMPSEHVGIRRKGERIAKVRGQKKREEEVG